MNYLRFDELYSMVQVKIQVEKQKLNLKASDEDLIFCYDILKHVSRSFAHVIAQLNDELRDAVCIFYLVLRGLDTVEDDMDIPIPTKKIELPVFHEKLYDSKWCIDGIGKGKERTLLQEFYRVSKEFMKLKQEYRDVISDICKRMADGMCHFLDHEVVTKNDYDMYCHFVAGLVGHGLTRLFANCGFENPRLADDLTVANHMGLFLQKTNIIRDYFEDISESPPRIFWPREIWSNFTTDIHNFKNPEHRGDAMECLHAMIADALTHVPFVIEYMASLKERSVFLFCAIPQVMAIATLAKLYANKDVFCDKVKIRKGLACKIMLHCDTLDRALAQFLVHLEELESALREDDPSYDASRILIAKSKEALRSFGSAHGNASFARSFITHYPALGGQMVYNIIDSVGLYFRKK